MNEPVRLEIRGPLALLTIEHPPLNVLTVAMMREMARLLDRAAASDGVRLIRIEAVGKVFSAGVDVGEHCGDSLRPMMGALKALFDTLEHIEPPTVSVVHGAALGGGCELVLGTDLCWASERASFAQPEIKLGVFAPPASVLLPRLVGERRALGLLLSGEILSAAEAERIGLVNRIFPEADFREQVEAATEKLLQLSGTALRFAKRAVVEGRSGEQEAARSRVDRIYLEELMSTHDAQEGLASFVEKRPPSWQHR